VEATGNIPSANAAQGINQSEQDLLHEAQTKATRLGKCKSLIEMLVGLLTLSSAPNNSGITNSGQSGLLRSSSVVQNTIAGSLAVASRSQRRSSVGKEGQKQTSPESSEIPSNPPSRPNTTQSGRSITPGFMTQTVHEKMLSKSNRYNSRY
jgi:hypothetical protein